MENENRKAVYLSPSTQKSNIGIGSYGTEDMRMNEIADILEKKLKDAGYEVFRNNSNMTLDEVIENSNTLSPDIHVALHSNAGGGRGPEIFTNREGMAGDRLARVVYDELLKVYYDKALGRGIKYTDTLKEIRQVLAPAILIEIGFHDNEEDARWILESKEAIANAIFLGIEKYFDK